MSSDVDRSGLASADQKTERCRKFIQPPFMTRVARTSGPSAHGRGIVERIKLDLRYRFSEMPGPIDMIRKLTLGKYISMLESDATKPLRNGNPAQSQSLHANLPNQWKQRPREQVKTSIYHIVSQKVQPINNEESYVVTQTSFT